MKLSFNVWLVASVVLLCSFGCARRSAYEGSNSQTTRSVNSTADVVRIRGSGSAISPGNAGEWDVIVQIEPDYHVNANPATFSYLIPTEVTAGTAQGLTVGKPIYPPGEKKTFQFADEPLAVYEGEVQIKLPIQVASNSEKGSRTLPLTIRVQACDQEKCFPPATFNTQATIGIR